MTTSDQLQGYPYGAVYFRKSHPPEEDWERDYAVAAEDGGNIFRHWFLWSAIEIAPGEYDWADYDAQLDLAAQNKITTIIAEMMNNAPEWAFRQFPEARYVRADGSVVRPQMGGSCATGGFPGLCLDHDGVRELAGNFLRALATRYHDHPGMGGYDVWNECNYAADTCFCPATLDRFRDWLKERYESPRAVGRAWRRPSFADWADIEPPRGVGGAYPDQLDWLRFRLDNAYGLMRWRIEQLRGIDSRNKITAHGIAASLTKMAPGGADDWRAAAEVESYGMTWGSSRHGDEPWRQLHAIDLVRAASRGKPFWHAESYAGPLWMQPQVINKPRDEGRIATPDDVRYWNLVSMAGGARGVLYLRWRPLVDGPLFGAFGGYGMDGSRTERSAAMKEMATWANAPEQAGLWRSAPVKGDLGIIYLPDSQLFAYAQQGHTDYYARAMEGAYAGFLAGNIQADWVHIDHLEEYELLYLPYPIMVPETYRTKITAWVEAGGTLISEGCPGYFGDGGRVAYRRPGWLEELFGAAEDYVEFTPDLLDGLELTVDGARLHGSTFLQAYRPTTGTASGWYDDGRIAAVDHAYGDGRTRLIGTFPGAGFARHPEPGRERFFADLLGWAGREQQVITSDRRSYARLSDGDGGRYLWVLNPTRQPITPTITLSGASAAITSVVALRSAEAKAVDDHTLEVTVPARDAGVFRLG
ncbi:beta-galactosidase [Microlunatus speluncae]|uniref:beta-galactosidase n=1 Tax=Microlunatus speluncae TaxID=2594267 RepID=UPI001375A779|nr:alpha-amylase family protein [Microlunatus speluncae]